ncbi:MAG: hypothetical protein V4662_12105 [Verrucomicrobiota bacterium]
MEIDITDSAYAAAHTAEGVFLGAVNGEPGQFATADFQKCRAPISVSGAGALGITALNNMVLATFASSGNLTVPPESTVAWPDGAEIQITRLNGGAFDVGVTAGAGVTIRSESTKLKCNAQYSVITLRKIGTDTWVLSGDRKA